MYRVVFETRVGKEDAQFIPKSAMLLIQRAITQRLSTAPVQYGEPMRYEYAGYRRLRVSTYRIIYKVNEDERLVMIHAIGHRKEVYDQ